MRTKVGGSAILIFQPSHLSLLEYSNHLYELGGDCFVNRDAIFLIYVVVLSYHGT